MTHRGTLTAPERTEAFSDAVFAIAITLLVLELHVPAAAGSLLSALARQWPSYAAYVVSFVTIGIIWINHHALFDRLARLDRGLLLLNLLFLMTVSVLPFPTAIVSQYMLTSQSGIASMIYSANMAVMGAAFGSMWLYVLRWRPQLLAGDAMTRTYSEFVLRFTIGGPIYALAAIVALRSAPISLVICAVLAVYYAVLPTPGRARHHNGGE